jgi:hypothetical protein
MKARGRLIGLACAAIAVLALPAVAAAAKPGFEVKPKSLTAVLDLKASNGYEASVVAKGNRITLNLSRGKVQAAYEVKGTTTLRRIDADFGALGQFSGRFVGSVANSSGKAKRQGNGCRGRSAAVALGTFRGSFHFSGEEGFTEIDAASADGVAIQTFRRVCEKRHRSDRPTRASAAARDPETTITVLASLAEIDGRRVGFGAFGIESVNHGRREVEFGPFAGASVSEHREGVSIHRTAFLRDAGNGIIITDPKVRPVSASVALPSPFSGTASYLEIPGAPATWSGDLSVSLPGAAQTPLTGPGFNAVFCRVASERQLSRCTKQLEANFMSPRPNARGQLSGSQSQAFGDTRLSWLR